MTSCHDQQPRDNLRLWSHHQQRVPCSFQRQPATSPTLVPTSFPLVPDSQPTVAINRGQATTVLSEHRNKEQRKRTQQRSATMFAVFLLCVLRDTLCLTPVMGCAHMDDHRACRVTSVHTLSTMTKKTENNKCSAVAMWMVKHKHFQTLSKKSKIPRKSAPNIFGSPRPVYLDLGSEKCIWATPLESLESMVLSLWSFGSEDIFVLAPLGPRGPSCPLDPWS